MDNIVFLIQCPDQKGLLANISSFFYQHKFNILHCQQFTDLRLNQYFMRVKLDMKDLSCSRKTLETEFGEFAKQYELNWSVHYSDHIPRVAIMVSKASHCLYDLILRQKEEELNCEVPLIVSNHPTLEYVADQFKIPFYCCPITKKTKPEQEKQVLELLKKHHVDLIVLARYMQILSDSFVNEYPGKIINIHHAFLPAFQGANPYQRAYERGVKMIGATAHYAIAELDQGPIIEQDVQRVNHEYSPDDLKAIGRDIESMVLCKAVKAHIENRIIVANNKTIVFSSGN